MPYNKDYLSGPVAMGSKSGQQLWTYTTTDASAAIVTAGYFTDVGHVQGQHQRGMKVGDIVIATKVTALPNTTPLGVTVYVVSAIDADGDATVIATAIA